MELIPGIHQRSVRQHGSQIFLCQKYRGGTKKEKLRKEIGRADDQFRLRNVETKKRTILLSRGKK